jgi:hypothetical protein
MPTTSSASTSENSPRVGHTYACAKANRATLLFKGDDFTKTDIAAAG